MDVARHPLLKNEIAVSCFPGRRVLLEGKEVSYAPVLYRDAGVRKLSFREARLSETGFRQACIPEARFS